MFFKLSNTRWALLFASLCMLALGLSDNIRGPLFPELIRFFSLSNSQASLSFALASGAAFCGTVSMTYLLRTLQLNRLMWLSMMLMAAGLVVLGVAASYEVFMLGTVIYGFSLGTTAVSQNLLITENVHGPYQSRALSGLHGVYGLSSLIAPWLASRAPGWFSGDWRNAFFVTAGIAATVMTLILSTRPRALFHQVAHVKTPKLKGHYNLRLWLAGFFACYVGAEILVSTRLALYMRTYFEMDLAQSSNYVSYFFGFLLLGRLIFTLKSFNYPLKTQLNAFLIFSLLSLLLGLWLHPFFLSLVGFTMAPFYPLAIVYISDITGAQKRNYLTFVMGVQGLCVISMHVGVGYITDAFGLFYAFTIGIFLLLVAIACLNLHPKNVT
jgi:fucose permease